MSAMGYEHRLYLRLCKRFTWHQLGTPALSKQLLIPSVMGDRSLETYTNGPLVRMS